MIRFFAVSLLFAGAVVCRGETLVERLLAEYDSVNSVSCEVRKDTEGPAGSIRTLSRVYYRKPDKLHVENVMPVKRKVIADGVTFASYIEGDPRGFSRPISKLDCEMAIQLRKVPGTAMDHLMKLKGLEERDVEPTAEFPVRKGYESDRNFVVLSLDSSNRLSRVEFFSDDEMGRSMGRYDYSAFQEVDGGLWIPCLHQAVLSDGVQEVRETSRFSNLSVNGPIPDSLFDIGLFSKQTKFVDEFEKIYK